MSKKYMHYHQIYEHRKKKAYDAWLLKRKDERQTGKLMRVPSKYCAVFFQYCLHMSLDYTSIRRSNTENNVIITC